jgi:hypothetical protein
VAPNPSLHPTASSGLRPLPSAGELKRYTARMILGESIRLGLAALAAVLVALLVGWIAAHAIVSWYAWHYGLAPDADLSDDYGLGMLLFFGVPIAAAVSFTVSAVVGWRLAGRLAIVQRRAG